VWWDRQLTGGGRFLKETEGELNAAKVVLVVWSKTSIESHWVADEAGAGRDTGRLLPITLDGSMPPLGFRQFQVIDFSKWTRDDGAALKQLTDALGKLTTPSGEAGTAPKIRPVQNPLLKRPAVLAGLAAAGVAVIAAVAMFAMGPQASQPTAAPAAQRTAFFGFTTASSDPLASEIATNATEETFAALRILQIESAARGDMQGVALTGQLDKAAALGARYALGGDVRASGDEITVNIRLDDADTRATLWEETLTGGAAERKWLPVMAAGRASTLLECLISVRPDMVREDASALALVTRACQLSNIYDRQYVTLWRDAEQVAPNSLTVQRRIARGWNNQSVYASDAERPAMLQEARAALQRQLALRPTYHPARVTLATHDIASDRPLADIIAAMNAALQAADASGDRMGMDNNAILQMNSFNMVGRNTEAARLGRANAVAYPLSSWVLSPYGNTLWSAGQTLEARTVLDSSIRRLASVDAWSSRAAIAIGDGEDIAPILAAAPPAVSVELVACYRDVAAAARATDAAVRAAGASRLLGCVRAGIITSIDAIVTLSLLGQVDAAYTIMGPLLKRSNPVGLQQSGRAIFAPRARPIRADPRFLPLMRETGIYQYWLDTKTQPDVCETPEERDFEVCVALRKDQGR